MLGRFGWKANVATLAHQTGGAFLGDIGITSSLFPAENCTPAQKDCVQNAKRQAAQPGPIKGVPNRVWDAYAQKDMLGRFGRCCVPRSPPRRR
ncbi:di-heme oxidoredictase family protein [Mycobacterium tuberculosis]|uniref:di-heme oxidoredictase family protein n=1 Tax=Mycobacterium tuberculosis TaxID=1773 RepID=UPI00350ED824